MKVRSVRTGLLTTAAVAAVDLDFTVEFDDRTGVANNRLDGLVG